MDRYHTNLTMATLHVESLCQLAVYASEQLNAGATLGAYSVTYGDCVRLAAGALDGFTVGRKRIGRIVSRHKSTEVTSIR